MRTSPYGLWDSPITAETLAQGDKTARSTSISMADGMIYWTEARPLEKGRIVLIRRLFDGTMEELTPEGFDIRSKVHEYGGLSFAVRDGVIFFVNAKDQRIYEQTPGQIPHPLTEEGIRFAEPVPTLQGLLCIAEKGKENFLALVHKTNGAWTPLDVGHDFYGGIALSADQKKIAWITWDHPQMPWDGTELWEADFDGIQLKNKRKVAGGEGESIFQPRFSPLGNLYYISDRSGWWNFYREDETIYPLKAEFGAPLWGLGFSLWDFTGQEEEILCSYQERGVGKIALLNPSTKQLSPLPLGGIDYSQVVCKEGKAVFLQGSHQEARKVMLLDLNTKKAIQIDSSKPSKIDPDFFSFCEPIAYPTTDGEEAFAYFYPPRSKTDQAPAGTLPPLIVMSHGGPTASADPVFNFRIQYWTSRGFAVLDVNYAGSSGYGRAYREKLKGNWGIADVADCANGALYLASIGKVDKSKMVIRGGSAGGYTTLAALASTKTFVAGASYYGVADLELLANDTHKFESSYLESLVGPYPAAKKIYEERSPIHHADKIHCPVIFFQGGADKIVPPNQSEVMYTALKKRGIKTELVLYPEEEHGFRVAKNQEDSLKKEQQFYLDVFAGV